MTQGVKDLVMTAAAQVTAVSWVQFLAQELLCAVGVPKKFNWRGGTWEGGRVGSMRNLSSHPDNKLPWQM